jgi:hypothetical protein
MFERMFKLLFSPDEGGPPPHGIAGDVEVMGGEEEEEGSTGDSEVPAEETFGAEGSEEAEEEAEPETEETEEADKDAEVFEGRPTLTDIKTKYPKIFKEFPELREVLFREQELSKSFGSIEEAQESAAKSQNFDVIEAALLTGDSRPIIDQLATNAPESLERVVENFLPSILQKSQDLYIKATTPIIEQFIHAAYEHGKRLGDANLMKSMQHASLFIFGDPGIRDPTTRRASGPHPAEAQLQEERRTWSQQRFSEASQEVSTEIDRELQRDIENGLDPDKKLSERQRSRLIADIKDEIDAQLQRDEAFKRQMGTLWKRAGGANYPKDQRASIKSAFLARAKPLVPSVRSKLKAEWFGVRSKTGSLGQGERQRNPQGQFTQSPPKKRQFPESGGVAHTRGTRPPSPKEVDYNRTSDMDLIEGKFARRK